MDVSRVVEILEAYFPLSLQEGWDNSGLQISPEESSVKGVLLTLDVGPDSVDEAIENGCNLIIAHHPLLFNATKKIYNDFYPYNVLFKAIKHGIGIYAFHTNMDIAKGGLNDYLCRLLELEDVEEYQEYPPLRIGKLKRSMGLKETIDYIKERLKVEHVKFVKGNDRPIERIAICSGSCMELLYEIKHLSFDLFLSGDLKHHAAFFAKNSGINVMDATHYHTEKFAKEILKEVLEREGVKVVVSNRETIPWIYG